MNKPEYSLPWILPYVRKVVERSGNFNYETFMSNLWMQMEPAVPDIKRYDQLQQQQLRRIFDYGNPKELPSVANEAFFFLLRNGYIVPEVDRSSAFPMHAPRGDRYDITPRGKQWSGGTDDPLPEDADGYMKLLKQNVPTVDPVVEEYIRNGLIAFNGGAYFAAAVMVGAATEKAIYMLAEAMVPALKAGSRKTKLEQLFKSKRSLVHFLEFIRDTLEMNSKLLDPTDNAVTQIAGMFDAIRVQRNDAVHPQTGHVSDLSVRFTIVNFPAFLEKCEEVRDWLVKNPRAVN
jgi:hypothetical protein